VLFYVLFVSIVLFYVLFVSIVLFYVLFVSIVLFYALFVSIVLFYALFVSIVLFCVLFVSIVLFCVLFVSIVLFYILFVSIVLFCVLFVSIVLFYVLLVCKCVLFYCHRVATQLQLNIYHIISYQLQSRLTGFYHELCRALGLFLEHLSQNKTCYVHKAYQEWGKWGIRHWHITFTGKVPKEKITIYE
jgi:hypothetical protein